MKSYNNDFIEAEKSYLEALKDFQKLHRITDLQLKADTGIDNTALSRIKSGKWHLTIQHVKAITNAYPAMFFQAIKLIADPPCETPEELKERILKALEETR